MILPTTCQQYHNQQVTLYLLKSHQNEGWWERRAVGGRVNTEKKQVCGCGGENIGSERFVCGSGVLSLPGYNFGHSWKQCKQLIKHLRCKATWVAAFMWARHPLSYFGLHTLPLSWDRGLQSQLTSPLSLQRLWLRALRFGPDCMCLCASSCPLGRVDVRLQLVWWKWHFSRITLWFIHTAFPTHILYY